jgi:WD40 repeat protein
MTTQPTSAANPYVGPRTFQPAERDRFFGREREARDLLSLVIAERLTLFYAQSGAGKSSLINTRLIPGLAEAGFLVLPVARVSGDPPPGVGVVDNLFVYNVLLRLDQSKDDPARFIQMPLRHFLANLATDDGEHFYYSAGEEASHPETSAASQAVDPPAEPDVEYATPPHVLILDQFEEILTTHLDRWSERAGFFRQLEEAMTADPLLWVVLVLREDYVAGLDPYAPLLTGNLRTRYHMQRMGVTAALEAIRRPAKQAGRPFAAGVAEALVDNLRRIKVVGKEREQLGQYVEPVQLQVVCYQLWERLQNRPPAPITSDDLQQSGDVDSALAAFYEEAIANVLRRTEVTVAERQLRTWFDSKLITEAGTRGTAYQGQSETTGLPNSVVRLLVDQFLLRTELRAGGAWVELVHDRFVEPITKSNQAWLLRNQNPLTQAAQAWRTAGKPVDHLYRERQLAEAAAQLEKNPEQFGDLEREFVRAGQQAETQRKARRQRLLSAATLLAIAVLVGLTAWALLNANRANVEAQRAATAEALAQTAAKEARVKAELALTAEASAVREAHVAATAQAQTNIAKDEIERLTRAVRADQLSANGVKIVGDFPERALLLAVEGINAQRLHNEPVVTSALENIHELLQQIGGQPFRKHNSGISIVAFSPDRRWLVSVGSFPRSEVLLWDSSTAFTEFIVLQEYAAGSIEAIFSPDSHWLAVGGRGETSRVWDLTQEQKHHTALRKYFHSLTFSPDGQWLAGIDGENAVYVQNMVDHKKALQFKSQQAIDALAYSANGQWLAGATRDDTILRWDVTRPNEEPVVLQGYQGSIESLQFSPDGQWLASVWRRNQVLILQVHSLEPLESQPRTLYRYLSGISLSLAFSPNGQWLASSDQKAPIQLWDLEHIEAEPVILREHEDDVRDLQFSPDGQYLASASINKTIWLWRVNHLETPPLILRGHEDSIRSIAFSPDTRWLVTAGGDKTIRVWNLASLFAQSIVDRQDSGISALAFSPDGAWMASAGFDGGVQLHSLLPGERESVALHGQADRATALAFSGDGHWLASGADGGVVRVWNLAVSDTLPIELFGHSQRVTSVVFSPDGHRLASTSWDKPMLVWEVGNWASSSPLVWDHPSGGATLAFSPDGQQLASATHDGSILRWEIQRPAMPADLLTADQETFAVADFSSDLRWLATGRNSEVGNGDSAVRIWDLAHFDLRPRVLYGHQSYIADLSFSPDGHWLASSSYDHAVILWPVDLPDLKPFRLQGHANTVGAVAFRQDGQLLATGSADGTIRLWTLPVTELIQLACQTAGRNLSPSEWQQYFGEEEYRKTCPNLSLHVDFIQPILDEGRQLAATGDIEGATAKFNEALQREPLLAIAPEVQARRIYARTLITQGEQLATEGYLMEAIATFNQALNFDPDLTLIPEVEAKWWVAQGLIKQGEVLAGSGDIEGAIDKFEEALVLDPSLMLEPEQEAKEIAAPGLVRQGRHLASEGAVEAAIDKFKEALVLDPSLMLEPEQEAKEIAAPVLVEQARTLAQAGATADALAKIEEARALAEELKANTLYFTICRLQTFAELAESVATSCEALVAQAPTIEPGVQVTGIVESAMGDLWKLEITDSSLVTITLAASANSNLDTYLTLYDPSLQLVAEHDDIASQLIKNSQLNTVVLTKPGLYWIGAGRCCPDNDQLSVGNYVLEVIVETQE